jgi:hypothetical protein
MSIVRDARNALVGAMVGAGIGADQLEESLKAVESERMKYAAEDMDREAIAREGLADVQLALDDVGWRDISSSYGLLKFNRTTIRQIVALSRIMYIVNPLIKRAVSVQELYVWGAGCTIRAENDIVDQTLKEFFEDPKNQKVIGQGEEGWTQRERDQRTDGNLFFAFITNPLNGATRVRLLAYDLVDDIICNPEDGKEVWYYRKSTNAVSGSVLDTDLSTTSSSLPNRVSKDILYPDLNWNPTFKPDIYPVGDGALAIDWKVRILHVRTGGLSGMKFGMPELYSALNWATAYKKILENFATILQAYARIAMKMTGLKGKSGVAAAKSKMNTSVSLTGANLENNPPTNTASWMMASGNVDVAPVKTAHSTTAPDEARALRSMVASGSDLPEHFFGDSEVGNFATSETLDRPTELKMIARQQLWRQVILQMSAYVIERSALAPDGRLREAGFKAKETRDRFDGRTLSVTVTPPAQQNLTVEVTFPNITERATTERVRALVNAATLNGRKAEGIFPDRRYLFKLMLEALGVRDVETQVDKYYPASVTQGFIDPADVAEDERLAAQAKKETADAAMLAAKTKKEAPTPSPSEP